MENVQLEHDDFRAKLDKHPICFLLNDFDSPANVGSIFRIADAFGVENVFLTGTSPIPPNRKMIRTSRSTEKFVPYSYYDNGVDRAKKLKAEGYKILSLEVTSTSTDIRDLSISRSEKICLILGSENVGVNQQLLDLSDETIHIPMLGKNSSINVASACSIATFEIVKTFLSE